MPDGTRVLNCVLMPGGVDGGVAVWDVRTGERVCTLEGHDGLVTKVTTNADGSRVLTAGRDRSVRVWDGHRYELLLTLRTDSIVGPIGFSPDGRRIAAGTAEGAVYVWNAHPKGR
jgi:WD40 repeat protein